MINLLQSKAKELKKLKQSPTMMLRQSNTISRRNWKKVNLYIILISNN